MKKGKKTVLPSRRRRALKRTAITLVLLFCINYIMHIGLLLPRQAVHQIEERKATGWTQVVAREWTPEIHKTHLAYLSQNENATLFSSTYLTFYGWMVGFGVALDCTEEAQAHAGFSTMYRKDNRSWYFFGRVDDPAVQRVELSLCREEADAMSHPLLGAEVRRITDIELMEQSGRRYFLVKDRGEWDTDRYNRLRPILLGFDENDREILRMEIEEGIYSYYG